MSEELQKLIDEMFEAAKSYGSEEHWFNCGDGGRADLDKAAEEAHFRKALLEEEIEKLLANNGSREGEIKQEIKSKVFKPGDKVTLIDKKYESPFLKFGEIYTVVTVYRQQKADGEHDYLSLEKVLYCHISYQFCLVEDSHSGNTLNNPQ